MRPYELTTPLGNVSSSVMLLVAIAAAASAETATVDYERDVHPVLAANCIQCHNGQDANGDLRLDIAQGLLRGGGRGPAVVPKKPKESVILKAVTRSDDVPAMPPPDEGATLSPHDIEILRQWIKQGAPISDARLRQDHQLERLRSDHWSFQPISRPVVPHVFLDGDEPSNLIDAFILNELSCHGISPSMQATRETLIRRVSLDLIGLPPSPEEVNAFVSDSRPDAYEHLVDRLLSSPHYGERWARWWLDQARYADSDGYTNDEVRLIWKYRDYVIDAFNRDLPFDQFVVEQLAGDLLRNAGTREIVATGFHRNTQTYSEGDSATEEYRVENVVDRVHTTGVVFLGLTLGCARCHNHKFDPISQREFFEMYAFFNTQDDIKIEVPVDGWSPTQSSRIGELPKTTTLVLRERVEGRPTHVHIRGDYLNLGRRVTPNVPSFLPPLPVEGNKLTRLDLARWIVSLENPLTARVIANRVWQVFFGRGIVETDDDFGTQGAQPTNPELLDWLASSFQDSGWRMKALHRQIVTSGTYKRASNSRMDLLQFDPRNEFLARQARLRLDAELIRDSALVASGLLSKKLGGPSVYPPQAAGAMQMTQHMNRQWIVSTGEDRYRRGIYTFIWRLAPYTSFAAFNAPNGNVTCTRRMRANTPVQALTLLNDEMFVEAAHALAVRVLSDCESRDDKQRANYAFKLCLARDATERELRVLLELLHEERSQPDGTKVVPKFPALQSVVEGIDQGELLEWTAVARTLLNLDEFITRE